MLSVCRRCFLIYRYPGKPATIISMDNFVDKVMKELPAWPEAALLLVLADCLSVLLRR